MLLCSGRADLKACDFYHSGNQIEKNVKTSGFDVSNLFNICFSFVLTDFFCKRERNVILGSQFRKRFTTFFMSPYCSETSGTMDSFH